VQFVVRFSIVSLMTIGLAAYTSSSASQELEPAPTRLPNFMSPSETTQTISEEQLTQIPVRERPRYGYEPIGYRVGPVFFYPQLLSELRYDSNVYANSANRRADLAAVLAPKLTITTYSPRFSFKSEIGATIYRYRELHGENHTDAYARFRAHGEIAHDLRVDGAFQAAHLYQDRSDSTTPSNAATPIPFTDIRGEASATKDFNRLSVMVGGSARNLTYENVQSFTGQLLDQSSRNGTILTAFVKPSYEITRDYRLYMLARYNVRNYEGTGTLEHDSNGYDLRGGVQFALTPLILGSVEAGYLQQTFNNPAIPTVNAPLIAGRVKWLVTPLTTISFVADRSVNEMGAPGQEARLDMTYGAVVDHELMRNVILFAGARHINQDFKGTPRKDDLLKFSGGVDYLANRFARVGLQYDFIDRKSNIPAFSFNEHVLRVNVTAQY
jgi:hypothetical protein